jgi:DEAD/DEAH box helicase domain-containing protein
MSIGVLYDYNSQRFYSYTETEAGRLVDELLTATKVIGFNIEEFDYPVLSAYRPEVNFKKIPTLDLLKEFYKANGFRVSLDNLAQSTLGVGKSADGLAALAWYKEGRMDLIEKYCRDDVDVTRQLYEFGRDRKFVRFKEKTGEVKTVTIDWS